MRTAGMQGTPAWVDLSAPDPDVAAAFYGALLGWSIERSTTPMGDYLVGSSDDLAVGGMMAPSSDEAGMPSTWTAFFHVSDVDETLQRAEGAGGTVLQGPVPLADGGHIGVARDPSGATFGVIARPGVQDVYLSPRPGAVCWVELMTRDVDVADDFYTTLFGWKAVRNMDSVPPYTTFRLNGDEIAGMMAMPDDLPGDVPAQWGVYFSVEDCQASEERAEELGGTVLRPTTTIEPGRFAVIADPQGATFQILEYADDRA